MTFTGRYGRIFSQYGTEEYAAVPANPFQPVRFLAVPANLGVVFNLWARAMTTFYLWASGTTALNLFADVATTFNLFASVKTTMNLFAGGSTTLNLSAAP
jgi:hypothetical protein